MVYLLENFFHLVAGYFWRRDNEVEGDYTEKISDSKLCEQVSHSVMWTVWCSQLYEQTSKSKQVWTNMLQDHLSFHGLKGSSDTVKTLTSLKSTKDTQAVCDIC